jgi:hypothetical protein
VSVWLRGGRPARRADVESVDVEGELVLWDDRAQRVHRLDPVASLLWPFLDGTATIEELAEDASEVWETELEAAVLGITNLVTQLDVEGLLVPGQDRVAPVPDAPDGPRPLITNPMRCGTDLSPWPWEPPTVVAVGDRLISFRTSDRAVSTALRAALRPHVVDADDDVPVNYSLALGQAKGDLHLLFWGHCTVARCRTIGEAVQALLAHLAGHGPAPTGSVRFDGHLLASHGAGVIFPANERGALWSVAARLRASGAVVVQRPWVDVDVRRAVVVATEAPLEVDRSALGGVLGGEAPTPTPALAEVRAAGLYVPDWMDASSPAALATALVQQGLLLDPATGISGFAELVPSMQVLHEPRDRAKVTGAVRQLFAAQP